MRLEMSVEFSSEGLFVQIQDLSREVEVSAARDLFAGLVIVTGKQIGRAHV